MAARRLVSDATFKFIGAVEDEWQLYSDNASDYTIGHPIGFGASSIVYQAEYHPPSGGDSIPCALKVLDLDTLPMRSLRLLRRETQLMSLSKHPNVLRVRGTWIDGSKLYIALRLMRSGSVADVMHYGWLGGVDEEVAKCILKQALDGLNYLHINGFIHRDVKAANFLIDDDGTVLLGDLGVATALNDEDSTSPKSGTPASASDVVPPRSTTPLITSGIGKRKSFVGTPCWMAPEVISQRHYDSKADIWSLGITALELAQGRAPRSRDPPHTILMKTIQDEPPGLDREGGQFKYSKAFKEIIQSCLTKDPTRRPTAEDLLQTVFFRSARKKGHLVGALLNGLPLLVDRQERRRIPSVVSPISVESWDFSQGVMTSPSSTASKRSFDDGIFEMDEAKEARGSSGKEKSVTFIPSVSPLLDARTETEVSPLGDSTDEALSTPSTSLLSSNFQHSIHTPSSHPVTPIPPRHRVAPSSSSPPVKGISSHGLWKKLRSIGSKASMDRGKLYDKPKAKGTSASPAGHIRNSLDYS